MKLSNRDGIGGGCQWRLQDGGKQGVPPVSVKSPGNVYLERREAAAGDLLQSWG